MAVEEVRRTLEQKLNRFAFNTDARHHSSTTEHLPIVRSPGACYEILVKKPFEYLYTHFLAIGIFAARAQ